MDTHVGACSIPAADGCAGARICAHRRESPIGQTTASWVCELPSSGDVHWVTATAAACTSVIKPVLLDIGLPVHGPTPGAKKDCVSLLWRHEKLRRASDHGIENLRAPYTSQRDALEATFLERGRKRRESGDEAGRTEAALVVEQCWHEAIAFETCWYEGVMPAGRLT